MDANKLARLKAVRYVVKRGCYNCMKSSNFNKQGFGVCSLHHYTHTKHIGKPRQLSVYITGCCIYHRWAEDQDIHGYAELAEE